MKKKIVSAAVLAAVVMNLSGCALFKSEINELKGSITGNSYNCEFYSNTGEKTLYVTGTNIDLKENVVYVHTYSDGSRGYTKELSSVITIIIDGHEIESCGDTIIFSENGLKPDVDFSVDYIESSADGIGDMTFIAKTVNAYKNAFGKARIVVIKDQLGNPICAYSGDDVYYEVCQDLPKTTKLYIDGKALYIHRANFQIIDKALIVE